jgi:integrase
MARQPTGITARHSRSCPTAADRAAKCRCRPTYAAWVYDRRTKRKLKRTFAEFAEAKAWRADSVGDIRRQKLRAVRQVTLRERAAETIAGMKSGAVRTRSGDVYKPSVIRGYESALRETILPDLGGRRLNEVTRADVQRIADEMLGAGANASTVRNHIMPLRVVMRRALEDGEIAINPCVALRLPAVRGKRDRIVSPTEAAALLDALPGADRPLWATAFYAGLRLGELAALDVAHVDLAKGLIRVERSWDPKAGLVEPKSRAGKRAVPIPAVLRDYLDEHILTLGRGGLVFGRSATRPFNPSTINDRATRAWVASDLVGLSAHEARHTYASLMIAAGVNAKAISTYMGHSSVTITYDRYGHLMPGNEDEAAALLDAYLERANTAARLAQFD